MKNTLEDDQISMILKVRAMRVDGLRRLRAVHEAHVVQKSQEIVDQEQAMHTAQVTRIADERESLAAMLNKETVKVDSIVSFIKLQQRGVRQLNDIRQEIETVKEEHEQAIEVFRESEVNAQKAEKRLIAIEEVIKGQLWK